MNQTKLASSSITFSPRSDPLHHEFAGELLTLPSRNAREFGEYLSLMTVLWKISTSQSQENVHANQSSVSESLPVSLISVEDSEPAQEEIDIFLVPDVRIYQKSQENRQKKRANTDTRNGRTQEKPKIQSQSQIPPGIDLTLPPTLEVSSGNPTSPTLTREKDLAVALDSTKSSILPTPLLDSDSPFTAELSASIIFNFLGNEDKVFKPGILVYHTIHDKNLVTLEKNLRENISSGTLLFLKEPLSPRPPPEPPDVCMRFKPILAMKNDFVKPNEDFYLSETVLSLNVEDVDSFTFIIWTFLPYFTYPEDSPLIFSFRRIESSLRLGEQKQAASWEFTPCLSIFYCSNNNVL
ncbi:hypothetical protein Tco_0002848 [Tanacetum coccineum]